MKRSIAPRAHAWFFTAGSGGRTGARNDHSGWYSAPAAIHCRSVSFCRAVSVLCDPGRRHPLVGVVGKDAPDQFALLRLAGDDGARLDRRLAAIQPQIGLARGAVRAVAGETVLRQDGADIVVEGRLLAVDRQGRQRQPCKRRQDAAGGKATSLVHRAFSARKVATASRHNALASS